MIYSHITELAYYLPQNIISTNKLENIIQDKSDYVIPKGLINTILGVKHRRRSDKKTYSSTLSIGAIKKLSCNINDIDLLIYASTTQDCIEPSTSIIILSELGLSCHCFDVQNACNSMINAIEIANSFIISGTYKKILIVGAETPSKAIKLNHHDKESFKKSFSSFGMGDASVAIMIEKKEGPKKGFLFSKNITDGSLWQETTILGGGSRYYDTIEYNFFIGNPTKLKEFFLNKGLPIIKQGCKELGINYSQFEKIFVHQVGHESYYSFLESINISEGQLIKTYENYGNIGSCTVPLQIALSKLENNKLYLIVGFGAGASFSCHIYQH